MLRHHLLFTSLIAVASANFLTEPKPPVSPPTPSTPPAHNHDHHHGHDHGKDLNGVLERTEEFSALAGLLRQAELVDAIETDGPYTVFAPTNEAFGKLPEALLEKLAKPENKADLRKLLLGHIVKGKLKAADLKTSELETLAGTKLKIIVDGGKATIGGAAVEHPDIDADNGVIHGLADVIR